MQPKLSAIVILWILALAVVPLRLLQFRDRDHVSPSISALHAESLTASAGESVATEPPHFIAGAVGKSRVEDQLHPLPARQN